MNPRTEKIPEIGEIMYTYMHPDDEFGLEISDKNNIHVVIILTISPEPNYIYSTLRCVTESGKVQLAQYLDIHYTKEEAHRWYEKYYGKSEKSSS